MALRITEDCIVCNACLPECPNSAIYEPGVEWALADGSSIKNDAILMDGTAITATSKQPPILPLGNDYYYIVPDKCTECQGFHEEPQCAYVCPVDACVPDEMYQETVAELMVKKERLHA
ncbi:MAG: 4Fe-4S dicluster domain-containing protein [Chitinophagaceae bacterium]|nr:MAG: 4Fe-4S dicluster domain-containing protein [Chitinophagaceae bacterium]